jgi:hypothetical protein
LSLQIALWHSVKKKELTQRRSGGPQRDTEVAFVNSEVFAFEIFVVKNKPNLCSGAPKLSTWFSVEQNEQRVDNFLLFQSLESDINWY